MGSDNFAGAAGKILNGKTRGTRYAILSDKFRLWTPPRFLPKRLVDRAAANRFGIPKSFD